MFYNGAEGNGRPTSAKAPRLITLPARSSTPANPRTCARAFPGTVCAGSFTRSRAALVAPPQCRRSEA